jgi:predicted ATPase
MRVAQAACLPLTMPLPLDPALELLRSLGEPVETPLRGSRRELFGIALEGLERASVGGPFLLCIDDLQWSDAATIDLVHYCLARWSDVPIAWLLAARFGRPQARLAHRLEREQLVTRLELDTLSVAATRLLCESMLRSSEVTDGLVDALHERTGGNPFLSLELLRALAPRGPAAPREGGSLSGSVRGLMPYAISEAIEARSARLSAAGRSALLWAAVLPEPFTFEEP